MLSQQHYVEAVFAVGSATGTNSPMPFRETCVTLKACQRFAAAAVHAGRDRKSRLGRGVDLWGACGPLACETPAPSGPASHQFDEQVGQSQPSLRNDATSTSVMS